jgi:hypothetical protein
VDYKEMNQFLRSTPIVRQFHLCEVKGFIDEFRELFKDDQQIPEQGFNRLFESKSLKTLEFSSVE